VLRQLLRNPRTIAYAAIIAVLLLCLSLPTLALAAYNVVYLPRVQTTPTSAATSTVAPTALTPTATSTPAPLCGGPRAMFILLVGSDSRADSYAAGLADSIRVVRIDFVNPGIMLLAFPRDLYVEIPGISEHGGITHGKLNQAYLYGNPAFGYFTGPGRGPGLLALTMRENFGTQTDHYVAVNLQTFVRVIDQLGGLDINLPYTIDGRVTRSKDPDRYFPAGQLHLDGYRTMLLARLRPNGDLQRSAVQNLILQALAAKILTPSTLPKLPALVNTLYGSVQTDMGASEIGQLLCLGSKLDAGRIHAVDFPDAIFTGTRIQDPVLGYTFVWNVDFGLLRQYVSLFNAGSWPATPLPIPSPTPTPTKPSP
jgi:polyisoprenyl-teichoic acid--peptidoglycan teichoic acid transferase